jgi:hypothetical protein
LEGCWWSKRSWQWWSKRRQWLQTSSLGGIEERKMNFIVGVDLFFEFNKMALTTEVLLKAWKLGRFIRALSLSLWMTQSMVLRAINQ